MNESVRDQPIEALAAPLLEQAGLGVARSITPLEGGGNNRAFRVDFDAGEPVLLKRYFRHPDDPRDRLAHEFGFSRFVWDRGLRGVPEPLVRDDEHGIGVYRFINSRMLEPAEVTPARVGEAIRFFTAVNTHRDHTEAQELPPGSEACFSNLEHVALVDQRVRRLDTVEDPGAGAFVERELKPAWAAIHPPIAKREDALVPAPRCLSPSDFGFHNAMLTADDALVFHDFEYAGWDDPAKLLGDFFHQPRRPAPWSAYPAFEDAVIETLGLSDEHRQRFRMLLPVYRIKWCCIILNPLLPGGAARRRYAGVEREPAELIETARQRLHAPIPEP